MQRATVGLVTCALFCGGWMLFDGTRALLLGDYVRIDGELGPWAALPRAIGMDPVELAPVFVALGALWLVGGADAARGRPLKMVRLAAVLTLWYVPLGTGAAITALALAWPRRRG